MIIIQNINNLIMSIERDEIQIGLKKKLFIIHTLWYDEY